jgi:hypothetical protein
VHYIQESGSLPNYSVSSTSDDIKNRIPAGALDRFGFLFSKIKSLTMARATKMARYATAALEAVDENEIVFWSRRKSI